MEKPHCLSRAITWTKLLLPDVKRQEVLHVFCQDAVKASSNHIGHGVRAVLCRIARPLNLGDEDHFALSRAAGWYPVSSHRLKWPWSSVRGIPFRSRSFLPSGPGPPSFIPFRAASSSSRVTGTTKPHWVGPAGVKDRLSSTDGAVKFSLQTLSTSAMGIWDDSEAHSPDMMRLAVRP